MSAVENYILHIETSTSICSVALSNGEQLVSYKINREDRAHSRLLTILIQQCIESGGITKEDLAAISFSVGPGSYTSLRVGLSVAKGLSYGLDIPIISVDTLKAIARKIGEENHDKYYYWPMIDARRNEVYAAFYDSALKPLYRAKPLILEEGITNKDPYKGKKIILGGDGAIKAKEIINDPDLLASGFLCDAQYNIIPAFEKFLSRDFEDLAYFKSLYLKGPNITRSRKTLF